MGGAGSEFKCTARVEFMGEILQIDKIITRIKLEDIMPQRDPALDPFDISRVNEATERRKRLVDYIASQIAYSLTEALFNAARSR